MIQLRALFMRETLSNQGGKLYTIVAEQLISSIGDCVVDFSDVSSVSPIFFQDFIFPLVAEFGSTAINNRLKLINLKDEHRLSYQKACSQTDVYMDKHYSQQEMAFGDISEITCDLLIKARELSRNNPSAAKLIFGINSNMIESFSNMDMESIRMISNSGVICFEPRLSPEFAAKLAALDPSEIDVFLNIAGDLEDFYESEYA
jgi:hypothetical protein